MASSAGPSANPLVDPFPDPFDGRFALSHAYPLAVAAYNEPWNSQSDPVLATLTHVEEILVDTQSHSFARAMTEQPSPAAQDMLNAMLRPKGAGTPPRAAAVAAAEGFTTGREDADAPLPGPDTLPATQLVAPAAGIPIDRRFGWTCVDASNRQFIITFRGTQSPSEWIKDMEFAEEAYRPLPNFGKVHGGFQHVYYAVRDNVLRLMREQAGAVRQVLIVGHSLGSALATLAMPDVLEAMGAGVTAKLYNFASPRVGDGTFHAAFNKQSPCWRIANLWDVVPHVPPVLAGFVHVGQQLTIDSGFNLSVPHNHGLATGYLPGLTKWNHNHPTDVKAMAALRSARDVPPGVID